MADTVQNCASVSAESLASATQRYNEEVGELRGPLELEVAEAVSVCWVEEKGRTIQARGKFGLRTKSVRVHEKIFLEEAERKVLSGALSQWHMKAEGDVAAAALGVGISEVRLLHASSSVLEDSMQDPAALLALLDRLLSSIAGTGAPVLLSSPSAFSTLRNLSFLVAATYQRAVGGKPDSNLLEILLRYAGQIEWASAIFQPLPAQIPDLLPILVKGSSLSSLSSLPSTAAGDCDEVKGQIRLLLQFPWESADVLTSEQMTQNVIPHLLAMASCLGQKAETDVEAGSDDADLATMIAKVLEKLAASHADLTAAAYGAVLLCVLCLARGSTVAEITAALGMKGQDMSLADILNVAQLVWSSPAAVHPKAALAAQVLQSIKWEKAAPLLPQALRLRLLLTLLAVYKGLGNEQPTTASGIYSAWMWGLLDGPLGATLTQLPQEATTANDTQGEDADGGANEVHMLCMTEPPVAREDVLALWAWVRAHLALGLLERWAGTDKTQAAGHADAMLEGMQIFSLPAHLINISKPQAVISILLRFFNVATLIGEPFFRSKLLSMAMMFMDAVQNSASDVSGPIREALHTVIHDGIAAAEAASHPQAPLAAPAASPRSSPGQREHTPPKRGSIVSPGPEALGLAAKWLVLLSCASARGTLPTPVLVLMSDLVQLLYYHAPPTPEPPVGTTDRGRAGSPVIQECMEAITEAIGVEGAQQLWVPLLKQHSANPVTAQWLPLLACWLSSAAGAGPVRHQKKSAEARPNSRSSSPKKPKGSPTRHGRGQETEVHTGASPPAAKGSQHERAEEEAGLSLDRNAEEALQLQEAAMRVGYGAAALPMWEEFLSRYFHYQEQLEPITPCADISAHLAELSHLYETSCPLLSNIYMLLAPLSPESLPGGTPNFIAGNTEALRVLMQLHPLKFGKPPKPQMSEAAAPPPEPASLQSLQKAVIPPSAYEDILKQQDNIAAQLASSADLLRLWSHRREKRQAAATPPRPAQRSSAADNSDSDSEAPTPARSDDLEELPMLKSPRMSQGSLDGDVPQVISQAQARLWEGLSNMAEHLDNLNAIVRELVVRRYKPGDIKKFEAGEYGDVNEIPADEDPEFQSQYQRNREAALAAAIEFLTGEGLAGAARLLYEVEVLLLGPPLQKGASAAIGGKGIAGDAAAEDQEVSCKAQLLAVVGETILDESMPAAAVPFLIGLFTQSAHRLLLTRPALKVELVGRLMAAFASRGQGASREAEAVALLTTGMGSEQLLAEGRLTEYHGCLACVLEAVPKLPPTAVGRLLDCFDLGGFSAALLHRGTPDTGHDQVQLGGRESGTAGPEKPSAAAARILSLAVDALAAAGGEAAGVELLGGLLAAGGHAAYFDACLAVVLGARNAAARDAGLIFLTRQPFDTLPINVAVEAMVQVTDDLNQAESARHEVPYALLQKLVQAPCSLSALRQVVATGTGELLEAGRDAQGASWTATLSSSDSQQGDPAGGSSSSGGGNRGPALITCSPQVMLLAVQPRGDAVGRIELLIGACLQSILRRFGSGLDGISMTEELTQLLALLLEPVGGDPWLVDWLWALYKEALQPFLVLAGPASDGAATRRFRECWACLPWQRATFHCISPGGLAELGAYLLAPDRGALDLLHALPWEPILQRLAPAAASGARPLPADGQQWATQLTLLVLQALVLLPAEHLPGWLLCLTAPAPRDGGLAEDKAAGLRLPHVIAAADAQALQDVLCNCVEGLPFLLQPLVDAPSLMQGDPGPRLLQVAGLLTAAARMSSSAAVAAMAASVINGIMFTSVCRGFISGQGHSPDASPSEAHGTTEVIECWHLTAEEHSLLVTECLLPVCRVHAPATMQAASILRRQDAHPANPAGSAERGEATPKASVPGWRAPQLSQLVDRLGPQSAAASNSQPANNSEGPQATKMLRGSRLAVLGPATHASSGAQPPAGDEPGCISEEQYIAAAVPAHALLSCLMACPRTVLTADPLPFANAETPLRDPPAHRDADDGTGAGSDAASSTAGSEAKPDFLDKAISMAGRLKIQRKGKRAPTRQRLLQAEAADLQTIQSHIAALIEDSCQRRAGDLPLSILRVGFTCAPLRRLPLGSTLLEDLVHSLLLSHPAAANLPAAASAMPSATNGGAVARERSYTEQTTVESAELPAADVDAHLAEAGAALLRTLEGLGDGAVIQICADAANAHTPLVQALASENARRATVLDERASWRHNVSQVLRAAAAAEARPGAPRLIAAVWLASLLWLEDARWRKLRTGGAPTDALESLLDALSRRVLLLNLPSPAHDTAPVTPSGAGNDAFDPQPHPSQAPDGGKTLTRLTQNFKRMLPSGKGGGDAGQTAQEGPAPQRKGLGRLKARFLSKESPTVDVPPSSFDYEGSMGFPEVQGPRFGRLDPIPSGDSEAGSSRPQTPSRASEYGSPPASPEEQPHRRGFGGLFVRTPSTSLPADIAELQPGEAPARHRPAREYASRLAGDVKKALTGGKKAEAAAAEAAAREAEAETAAEVATDVVIRLGLAAFAVSAYIKTVLCPSLSSYTPRMSSASLAADLASSGGAFAAAVLGSAQLQRQSASLGSLASASAIGTPRLAAMSTPSASLDKLQREDLLMHELDQVLEARAELDSLEEIARCPLVAARADQYRGFFAAAPQLLQPSVSVRRFQRELVQLLFPDAPFLAVWACLLPAAAEAPKKGGAAV